jgi:hypothetical protein
VLAPVSLAASVSGVVVLGDEVIVLDEDVEVLGVDVVVVDVLLELELLAPPPAGDGFTIVVFVSDLAAGEAPGATVSVFCSQAAKSAALARMQMYFFMYGWVALCGLVTG